MITISQFAQWMNATVIGTPTTETMGAPLHLLTDSRRLSFPEQSVFFAIQTRTNDGHRYLHELYNLRVRFFVISSLPEAASERFPEAIFFQVTDTLKALQQAVKNTTSSSIRFQNALNADFALRFARTILWVGSSLVQFLPMKAILLQASLKILSL